MQIESSCCRLRFMENQNFAPISILDSTVVDQIAAGEVVERPAHLVKELVENAIDAQASEIEIQIGVGGRHIFIQDNGCGFHPKELPLAIQRHATSKLTTASDLWALKSFGFRGEALASVAAVSDLTIRTHRKGFEALELQSRFGEVQPLKKSSCEVGTRIEVKDLFKNVPARLKFLKTDSSEVNEIKKVICAMALSYPSVGFRVFLKGEMIHLWPRAESQEATLNRNQQILGVKELYFISKDFNGIRVEAFFAPPHETAKSQRKIWLFVQERWVQEPLFYSAIKDGFQNTLLPGEYAIGTLKVSLPPSDVDVNVHPTKSKVKFKESSAVYRAVRSSLIELVGQSPWREKFLKKSQHPSFSLGEFEFKGPESDSQNKSYRPLDSTEQLDFGIKAQGRWETPPSEFEVRLPSPPSYENKNSLDSLEPIKGLKEGSTEEWKTEAIKVDSSGDQPLWSNLAVIGQVTKTYIVTQNEDEVVFIDQHAAHERYLFEILWNRYQGQGVSTKPFEVQRHLIPLTMTFDDEVFIEHLSRQSETLKKLGISWEQSGPTSIEITETPVLLGDGAVVQALERLLEEQNRLGESFHFEDVISDVFATMACHSAIRAGQNLSLQDMQSLLHQMDEYSTTSYCPHGRPVFVRYPFSQLEKDFCRRV